MKGSTVDKSDFGNKEDKVKEESYYNISNKILSEVISEESEKASFLCVLISLTFFYT